MNVVSSSTQALTVNITIGNYNKKPIVVNGVTYYSITNKQGTPILQKGFPDLPKITKSIVIPNFSGVSASVVSAEYKDYSMQVIPSKGILIKPVNPENIPYEFSTVYNENKFFPQVCYDFGEPYLLHGKRGMVLNVYPFAYNPVQHILRVYTSLTINISFNGLNTKNSLSKPEVSNKFFDKIYKNHFINFTNGNNRQGYGNEKMLIICHDNFLDKMRPFVTHKNNIGLNTEMVALSSVGNNPAAIKQFIQNRYNADSQLTFVLLVGDYSQISTFFSQGGGSDPSYSLLEGNDNYPDIIVGRFSAENTEQVETMVNRTISYETLPHQQTAWFKRGIGIASSQGAGNGDDGQSDYEHLRQIRTDLLKWNYTDIAELYDGNQGGIDATGNPTTAMIATTVNNGASLINYTGHGSTTGWITSGFSNTNINSLTNVKQFPFIFSVACINGNFTNNTCFAEAWLRATNNQQPTGAIGFYGSSINQSWQPPMEAQDKFNELLINENFTTFGELCFNASCAMIDKYEQNGVNMFLTWNYFGDPSVSYVDFLNFSISGASTVCTSGSVFTLSNVPQGATVQWNVTVPFTKSNATNTSVTITKTGTSNSNGTLTASIGGVVVATKTISPCVAEISGTSTLCYGSGTYTLSNVPTNATVQWNVTGSFETSYESNTQVTITRTGISGSSGTLTASIGGTVVASKEISVCEITGPSNVTSTTVFTLSNVPDGTPASVQWGVTGPFGTIDAKSRTVAVYPARTSYQSGTLTAYISGTAIASKTIMCYPEIIGPSIVCSTGGTFTVNNLVSGATVSWYCSSNLVKVSSSVNTQTFKSVGNGSAWVSVTVNGISRRFITYAGTPAPISSYWRQVAADRYYCYVSAPAESQVWEYSWNIGNWGQSQFGSSVYFTRPPSATLPHQITVYAANICGANSYKFTITGYSSGVAAYISPNPVSNFLNIELVAVETLAEPVEQQPVQSAIPLKTQTLQAETAVLNSETATVAKPLQKCEAKLYNQSGSQVRSLTFTGDKTQLNVSDLPAGIYYLHIIGVNDKPEVRQIIVQH
ncbi:MAG: C25 family cysteine peptidase [Prevotellaceae bacterium]|nr:C25 family cysteine peptidase [Prevotellaceae bacterium]